MHGRSFARIYVFMPIFLHSCFHAYTCACKCKEIFLINVYFTKMVNFERCFPLYFGNFWSLQSDAWYLSNILQQSHPNIVRSALGRWLHSIANSLSEQHIYVN